MSCRRPHPPYKPTSAPTKAKGIKLTPSQTPMHAMAQQVPPAASVAGNWPWEIHAATNSPFTAWSTTASRPWLLPPPNRHATLPPPPSSYVDEADMSMSNTTSFTNNASSHSALSMDSSSADLSGSEPVEENHIWNQVLLNVEAAGEVHNGHEDGENSLEVLNSKRLTTEVFEPAYDYLKKMDNSRKLNIPSSLICLEKHLNSYINGSIMEPQTQTTNNLSDLVSNWSIAPPNSQLDQHINIPSVCNVSNISDQHVKHELPIIPPSSYPSNLMLGDQVQYCQESTTGAASTPFFLTPHNHSNSTSCHIGLEDTTVGLSDNFCSGLMTDSNPWSSRRNLSDQVPVGRCSNKRALKPKSSDLCDGSKQGYERSTILGNGRVSATTEGKKKRSEDSSETLLKKSKYDSSMASSQKMQMPKVKIAEKISALQQLVSPFGKTDQASVLMETITCIRILQEQVQLLSDPYLKSSATKEHNSWGDQLERKEKAEAKHDLRSKGLCLVPVSSIPQVHRETNRPDYWMPTYRNCLYR